MNIDAEQIIGKQLYDNKHEKVGKISNLFIDETSHQPTWLTVKSGLLNTKENFVPLSLASIDVEEDAVVVATDKDTVEGAPRLETDRELLPAEQDRLYQYYKNIIWRDRQAARSGAATNHISDDSGQASDDAVPANDTVQSDRDDTTASDRLPESEKSRLKKYIITEPANIVIPLSKGRVRVDRETTLEDGQLETAGDQHIAAEAPDIILSPDEPNVEIRTMPKARSRTDKADTTGEMRNDNDTRDEKLNRNEGLIND